MTKSLAQCPVEGVSLTCLSILVLKELSLLEIAGIFIVSCSNNVEVIFVLPVSLQAWFCTCRPCPRVERAVRQTQFNCRISEWGKRCFTIAKINISYTILYLLYILINYFSRLERFQTNDIPQRIATTRLITWFSCIIILQRRLLHCDWLRAGKFFANFYNLHCSVCLGNSGFTLLVIFQVLSNCTQLKARAILRKCSYVTISVSP